ncbi:MAG: EXS family-domain-containing protein, partial [Olpidium bornovanus]
TVEFRDFFITDELNSLVYFFVSLQTFSCTYSHNWATDVERPCTVQFSWVTPFVSMLPGVWRTLQCLRRYRDTRQAFPHLVNAGKYTTSITVVLFSAAMTLSDQAELFGTDGGKRHEVIPILRPPGIFAVKVVWIVLSVIATVYTYCWDIFMDWGLGDRRSRNPMLRDQLVYSSKKVCKKRETAILTGAAPAFPRCR